MYMDYAYTSDIGTLVSHTMGPHPKDTGSVLVGPLEKRVFSSYGPCYSFFFLFVAPVSPASELTGSVAKKKSCNKTTTK